MPFGFALAAVVTAQLQLDWSAPAECPAESAVRASIERWLGGPAASALTVHATVEGAFTLTLDIEGKGTRKLEGQSCAELAEAGALVLALLLDPGLLTRPVPRPVESIEHDITFDLGATGVADYGALPSVAPGWHLGLGFEWKRLRIEAFGGTFLSQRVPPATLSLDFDVGLRPCGLITTGRAKVMACAALVVGRGSGHADVTTPQPGTPTFAAVYAGFGLELNIFWWVSALAHLEAGVPLRRTQYLVGNDTLYEMGWLVARGELGLQVRLW